MSGPDQDRQHAATPHKLETARKQGKLAKSPDVVATIVLAVGFLYMTWQGWSTWQAQFRLDRALLLQIPSVATSPNLIWPLVSTAVRETMLLAAPFLVSLVLAALLGNVIQNRPVLSMDPLSPDWQRLNPVTGLQRLLTVRTLFLALRAMLKLGLLGVTAYLVVRDQIHGYLHLSSMPAASVIRRLLDATASLGLHLVAMLALIALVDLIYSRREFAKNMRMSSRELKDEFKSREGDPRIRGRLRELRRDLLRRSLAVRNTRRADVLITNPTHVAIALRYVHGEMTSPQLIAKGRGFMAATMRAIAMKHGIPIVQNPALARALYRDLAIEQHVRPDLYAEVARIIVWVYARRRSGSPDRMSAGVPA